MRCDAMSVLDGIDFFGGRPVFSCREELAALFMIHMPQIFVAMERPAFLRHDPTSVTHGKTV